MVLATIKFSRTRPIGERSYVTFKNRVDEELIRVPGGQKAIGGFVGPIYRQSACHWNKPALKTVLVVCSGKPNPHLRPRNIVYPYRMREEKLGRAWSEPLRKPVVIHLS